MNRISKAFMAKSSRCVILRSISSATAELQVKVTSKSFIKPSSPTPPNLKNFKLSILDQFFSNVLAYHPTFVLFYAGSSPRILRESLSETLSHFYPFAGRIKSIKEDGSISTINCNDRGAEYLEAEANQEMSHFLSTSPAPDTLLLGRLAPPRPQLSVDTPLARFQTTVFRCGGIAVGVSLSHVIADGYAFTTLINHWAAVARGEHKSSYVHDMAASLFPINEAVLNHKPLAWRNPAGFSTIVDQMPATIVQRFVFKPEEISALKSRVKSSQVPNPSRTLAIFGLIWKAAMKAYTSAGDQTEKASSAVFSIVNLRPKFKTLLPDYSIGNLYWATEARHGNIPSDDELKRLTYELKRSIEKVDTQFVENLKGEKGHKEFLKYLEARGLGKDYKFSSGLRIGLNKVDFGSGKPIWVSYLGLTDLPIPDCVTLVEATPSDGRVEAWVSLTEKEMAIFQRDSELLQYAAVNPRVI